MTTWSMSRGEQQLGEGMSPLNKNGKTWDVLSDECQASLEDLETVEVEFVGLRFLTVDGDRLRGVCEDCIHIWMLSMGSNCLERLHFFDPKNCRWPWELWSFLSIHEGYIKIWTDMMNEFDLPQGVFSQKSRGRRKAFFRLCGIDP